MLWYFNIRATERISNKLIQYNIAALLATLMHIADDQPASLKALQM